MASELPCLAGLSRLRSVLQSRQSIAPFSISQLSRAPASSWYQNAAIPDAPPRGLLDCLPVLHDSRSSVRWLSPAEHRSLPDLRFRLGQAEALISHDSQPHAQPGAVLSASAPLCPPAPGAAAVNLSPHAWDPREDPSPWLRALLPAQRELPLSRLPQQPPEPAPGLPPQPQLPPLLLRLDRQGWPLPALENSPLLAWLTPEERQQSERLRRPEDRERHLLGRAGLRRVLGAWRRQEPQRVPLRNGVRGKPFCPGGPQFNVSHSGDLVLLALHPHSPVGVDVEQLRPQLDWRPLAARLLCSAECRFLEGLPAPAQTRAFLQAWCRLEARLKASGQGLAGLEALRRRAERAGALELGPGVERGARAWAAAGWPHGGAKESGEPAQAGERLGGLGLRAEERLWDVDLPAGYCGALACWMGAAEPGVAGRAASRSSGER